MNRLLGFIIVLAFLTYLIAGIALMVWSQSAITGSTAPSENMKLSANSTENLSNYEREVEVQQDSVQCAN
jgi:hypothetical protein